MFETLPASLLKMLTTWVLRKWNIIKYQSLVCHRFAVSFSMEAGMVKICSAIVKISSELVKISSELVEISSDLVWISSELIWRILELLKISVFRNAAMSVFGMPMSFCHRQISRILIFYFVRVFLKIATSSTGEELCSTFGLLLNLITSCSVSVGSWVSCNKIPLFPGWQLVATNDQIDRTYLASKNPLACARYE